MRKPREGVRVPLADAALRLGLTREQMLRRVSKREIAGGKDENGRWYVDAGALDVAEEADTLTR